MLVLAIARSVIVVVRYVTADFISWLRDHYRGSLIECNTTNSTHLLFKIDK
jgi:hypothetical protein